MSPSPPRGKRWALAAAALAAAAVAATGIVGIDRAREAWWLHRLRQGDPDESTLVHKLLARRCQRLAPILLERAPQHDVPLSYSGILVTSGEDQAQAFWLDALKSPAMTPGLVAVVRDATCTERERTLALQHLRARRLPLEPLLPGLLAATEVGNCTHTRAARSALHTVATRQAP